MQRRDFMKILRGVCVIDVGELRQTNGRVRDWLTAGELALCSRNNEIMVLEQEFLICFVIYKRVENSPQHELDRAFLTTLEITS